MRRYETFVIIDPDATQEQREPLLERVRELITQHDGFLVFEDVWGDRKLAYEIKKKARGFYIRFDYCGQALLVNEIERFFRIDDRSLKYMTIVLDKDVDLEKVKEEKAAAESQRETEPVTQDTPQESESADLSPEQVEEKQEEKVEPEPQVEEEAKASDTTDPAETTTPVEKKEEA